MPLSAQQIARDVRLNLVGDAPQTFSFRGQDYTGRISSLGVTKPLDIGGFTDEPILSLIVPLIDASGNRAFGIRPAPNDKVTIQGTEYRIERAHTDPLEAFLTMDLHTPEK